MVDLIIIINILTNIFTLSAFIAENLFENYIYNNNNNNSYLIIKDNYNINKDVYNYYLNNVYSYVPFSFYEFNSKCESGLNNIEFMKNDDLIILKNEI